MKDEFYNTLKNGKESPQTLTSSTTVTNLYKYFECQINIIFFGNITYTKYTKIKINYNLYVLKELRRPKPPIILLFITTHSFIIDIVLESHLFPEFPKPSSLTISFT